MTTSFDKAKHEYLIDGKKATGVTTIIGVLAKPALIGWAAKMATEYIREHVAYAIPGEDGGFWAIKPSVVEEAKSAHTKKKEAAGTHGTSSHEMVETWITMCLDHAGGAPKLVFGEEVIPAEIDVFGRWAIENVDHFLFSERQMYNKDLFIAGTADFAYIGKDGKKYMADFKTSSGIYGVDYFLQVSAYKMLAEAEGDELYDGMTIVRLGKDGKFEVQKLYEYETYKEAFLACLTLYRAQASIKELVITE